ncbi:MAG: hypothetical protein KH152_08775, partial [Finegoldia magna]|nr:hypothetical protein [Finegoldia magna]
MRDNEIKEYQNLLDKHRRTIPDEYNKIELCTELMNKDLDFYISISNRSDGKSFNYVGFFIKLAIEKGIGFMLVSRHFTLRYAYQELIDEIVDNMKGLNFNHVFYEKNDDYIKVGYKEDYIGIITDLNNATDLKYHSATLKYFPIIIYDEFLALEGDYLSDEWEKLKTIYQSIDRNKDEIPFISHPKIFLLGNAVNFSSPILANLDIFNYLQNHKINTVRQYDNILIELRKNDNVNNKKNLRAFDSTNDAMTTAQFNFNDYQLTSTNDLKYIQKDSDFFYIKTDLGYLKIIFNVNDLRTDIKFVPYVEDYQFCTEIDDVKSDVIFLDEKYYDYDNHH